MHAHLTASQSIADRLVDLGGVAAGRVRLVPPPGQATMNDLASNNESDQPLCELVDRTLAEKAKGYKASVVAMAIVEILRSFVRDRGLGIVSGPDGMFRLLPTSTRGPDVAFLSRTRLPDGKFPREAYPSLAPDLAVEVLSPGNTKGERARKRIEYFHSGVRLVWIVDCHNRSVAVYRSPDVFELLGESDSVDGGEVLPGFQAAISDFFSDLD